MLELNHNNDREQQILNLAYPIFKKNTKQATSEIIESILKQIYETLNGNQKNIKASVGDLITAAQTAINQESKTIRKDEDGIYQLADFIAILKEYLLKIKIAYHCPVTIRPFYELSKKLSNQLMSLLNYNTEKNCENYKPAIAQSVKNLENKLVVSGIINSKKDIEENMKIILSEATKLIEKIEIDDSFLEIKNTEKITLEIIESIIRPTCQNLNGKSSKDTCSILMTSTKKIIEEELNLKTKSETAIGQLIEYIEKLKTYAVAIEIADQCPKDKRPFYELVHDLLDQFENKMNYDDQNSEKIIKQIAENIEKQLNGSPIPSDEIKIITTMIISANVMTILNNRLIISKLN